MRRRPALFLVLTASMLLAACGGGGDDEGSPTSAPAVDDTTTTTSAGGAADTVDVGATVWFAGFELTFGEAAYDPTEGSVTIETTFENAGTDTAALDATLVLEAAGTSYELDDFESELPQVPGGTNNTGTLAFAVEDSFAFDDAVLTVGSPAVAQAVVPLGSEGELVTLEPRDVSITGSATAGQLSIDAHAGVLRADVPETHRQMEAGELALTITFDVTNSGTGGGGYAFGPDNLALTRPDGTTVAEDDGPIELLGHQATLPDQEVRFVVDDPAAGTYALLIREGDLEGQLEFEIPAS
jgi:hypothetical protein